MGKEEIKDKERQSHSLYDYSQSQNFCPRSKMCPFSKNIDGRMSGKNAIQLICVFATRILQRNQDYHRKERPSFDRANTQHTNICHFHSGRIGKRLELVGNNMHKN